jgi:hypothetical protein
MTHPRNAGYIKGDYWQNCDVCGFNYRRSEMKERWDALWVCPEDWEPRHPQEFLEGVPDYQAVPVARPDYINTVSTTTLTADMATGASSITVTSISGISDEDSIGIGLDDTTIHWTIVDGGPTGLTVKLLAAPFGPATSGNTVYIKGSSFGSTPAPDDL